LCSRIDDNLRNHNKEYKAARNRLKDTRVKLQKLENRLAEAENSVPLPSIPSRILNRNPVGIAGSVALSVFGAVVNENARANAQAKVDQLRAEVEATHRRIEELERQRADKEWAISKQQSDFAGNSCFDLGFSHEVMNFPF